MTTIYNPTIIDQGADPRPSDIKSKLGISELMKRFGGKDLLDLNLKNPKNATNICLHVLQVFEEIDSKKLHKRGTTSISSKRKLTKKLDSADIPKEAASLEEADKNFVYFLLNTSNQEFHKSYIKYYKHFDHSKNFQMTEQDFVSMLKFLCKKENIGKTKISRCFQRVATTAFTRSKQLDGLFHSSFDGELGPNLIQEMVEILQSKDGSSKKSIDYLKLLPIFIAFFSEDFKKKIADRQKTFEKVCGLDNKGERVNLGNDSLLYNMESLGLKYREFKGDSLSCRDIEKVLIMFRNSCPDTFQFKQIDIVMSEIQKKYKYNARLSVFKKQPQFNRKFLTYLSHVICKHYFCQHVAQRGGPDAQSLVVEEYVLWNIVANAEKKLDHEYIQEGLSNYASKYNASAFTPRQELDNIFANYIKNLLPSIQKKSIDNIINSFNQNFNPTRETIIPCFAENLCDLLIKEAENKLLEYIISNYEKFEPNYTKADKENQRPSFVNQSKFDNINTSKREPLEESRFINVDSMEIQKNEAVLAMAYTVPEKRDHSPDTMKRYSQSPSPMISNNNLGGGPFYVFSQTPASMTKSKKLNQFATPVSARNLDKEALGQSYMQGDDISRSIITASGMRNSKHIHMDNSGLGNESHLTKRTERPSSIQEKIKQSGKASTAVLNSCYIMEYFMERYTKSQFPNAEGNANKRQPQQQAMDEQESMQMSQGESSIMTDSIVYDRQASATKRLQKYKSQHTLAKAENFEIKPIEGLEYELEDYKSFNTDKLTFQKKVNVKKDKRGDVCGIECNMM